MTDEVLYETNDKIARITINRPTKMNSMNPPFMAELSAAFRKADEDTGVSVVILTHSGDHFGAAVR